ncbi:MAG: S-methyl-thioxylulose 5-phosphate methylthiotransferase [Alphaproteobacteria bacterium]|nr:S-methyl-thioxylulose 5-phosphate methylthiotransferase [Alphaproteobacteria bacterium]
MVKAMTTGEAKIERRIHRRAEVGFRWEGVEVLPYKEDERALFKSITRQVLFCDPAQQSELRYFEVAPGGFSTLERHEHTHSVLILRGSGQCLVGNDVRVLGTNDLVTVPALTWHQFRASAGEPLGFLCMVDATRDKPQLPSPQDLSSLRQDPRIAAFLRSDG